MFEQRATNILVPNCDLQMSLAALISLVAFPLHLCSLKTNNVRRYTTLSTLKRKIKKHAHKQVGHLWRSSAQALRTQDRTIPVIG